MLHRWWWRCLQCRSIPRRGASDHPTHPSPAASQPAASTRQRPANHRGPRGVLGVLRVTPAFPHTLLLCILRFFTVYFLGLVFLVFCNICFLADFLLYCFHFFIIPSNFFPPSFFILLFLYSSSFISSFPLFTFLLLSLVVFSSTCLSLPISLLPSLSPIIPSSSTFPFSFPIYLLSVRLMLLGSLSFISVIPSSDSFSVVYSDLPLTLSLSHLFCLLSLNDVLSAFFL